MTTITGKTESAAGETLHAEIFFTSRSTPQFPPGIVQTNTVKRILSDRSTGEFEVQLAAGNYDVSVRAQKQETRFSIAVPDGDDTISIEDLVTTPVSELPGEAPYTLWNGIRAGHITFDPITEPAAPTGVEVAYVGGTITDEEYRYHISYETQDGETTEGPVLIMTGSGAANRANRITMATNPDRVVTKKIYRNRIDGQTAVYLLAEVAPGVATYDDFESHEDFNERSDGIAPPEFNTTAGNIYSDAETAALYFSTSGIRVLVAAQFDSVITIPTNAGAGKILTSDAGGNATWQTLVADLNLIASAGTTPNSVITATRPSIAYDSDCNFWLKTNSGSNNTGWKSRLTFFGTNVGLGIGFSVFEASYINHPGIIIGNNGTIDCACMAVPNDFQIKDRQGNLIWFVPSHSGQNTANPTDGLLLLQGARDLDLIPGLNGNLQIGKTGGGYNQDIYVQYNQDNANGYSHLFGFRARSASDGGACAFLGQFTGITDYVDLHLYSKKPTFPAWPTSGLATPGDLALSMVTGSRTNTSLFVKKPVRQVHSTSSSATVSIDFDAGGILDVSPTASSVTISLTNYLADAASAVRKTLYLRSLTQTLSITWPANLARVSEDGSAALPTTLDPLKVLVAEFTCCGTSVTSVLVSVSIGDDHSFAYDADAEAYFDAMDTAGDALSTAEKIAVDTFVKNRKGITGSHIGTNTWTDADIICLFMGGSSAGAAVKLKGGADITWQNAPTFDANGVTFNGTDEYGQTGFNPSSGSPSYAQNSARMLVVIPTSSSTPAANGTYFCGVTATVRSGLFRLNGTNLASTGFNAASGTAGFGTASDDRGVLFASRTASGSAQLYYWAYNAASGASPSINFGDGIASTGVPSGDTYIGARNSSGAANHAAFTLAGFEAGAGVSQAVAQYIRDDYLALMAALSR